MKITQFLLLKLAEECNEVAQRASKQIQFGKDEIQKDQFKTNAERLREELTDLIAVAELLTEYGELPHIIPDEYRGQVNRKREKINKYYKYSIALGEMTEDKEV